MVKQPFQALVSSQDNTAILDLHGELNAFAEQDLNRAYDQAEQQDTPIIILNFTDVDYINSTGIALIVNLLSRARQSQRRLVAYGLNDHYHEIFTIARLTDFMRIVPDRASALVQV